MIKSDDLEWQSACTKALSESQERLAAELKAARTEVARLRGTLEAIASGELWNAVESARLTLTPHKEGVLAPNPFEGSVSLNPTEWSTIRTETYLHDTDHFLTVDARFPEQDFHWTVNGCLPGKRTMQELAEGYCATESEAKTAAILTARGLK